MLMAGVKGGIVGAVIAIALIFIGNFIPYSGLLVLIMPLVTGLLAGIFLLGPRSIGGGAGSGAIGAAIAGILFGAVVTVLASINLNSLNDAQLVAAINDQPSTASQLASAGVNPEQVVQSIRSFGPLGIGLCCIGGGAILWAMFGALGGMIGQSFKAQKPLAVQPYLGAGQPYYGQPPMGYDKVNPNYPHPPSVIGGETPPLPGQPLYPQQSPYGQPPVYGQPPYGQPPASYNPNDPNYPHPPSTIGGETPPPPYGQPPYGQLPYSQPPTDGGGDKAR